MIFHSLLAFSLFILLKLLIYLKNNYIYAKGFTDHKKFNDAIYFADESQLEQERKFFTDDENSKEMLRTMRQF